MQCWYYNNIRVLHSCRWFSTIHLRLRSVIISLQRVHRACHNDVVGHLADEEWCALGPQVDESKREPTDTPKAPVQGRCDASYPRVEKMGEYTYELQSPDKLDNKNILPPACGYKYKVDEVDFCSLIRPRTRPPNTDNKHIEKEEEYMQLPRVHWFPRVESCWWNLHYFLQTQLTFSIRKRRH